MEKLPKIIPGEGVRTQRETIYKRPVNKKIVAQRGIGNSIRSVVKKGVKFGLAGAALTGAGYYAFEPERNYAKAPKTYEPRDLRSPIIYKPSEDF
jgi:hypothetical protein